VFFRKTNIEMSSKIEVQGFTARLIMQRTADDILWKDRSRL